MKQDNLELILARTIEGCGEVTAAIGRVTADKCLPPRAADEVDSSININWLCRELHSLKSTAGKLIELIEERELIDGRK